MSDFFKIHYFTWGLLIAIALYLGTIPSKLAIAHSQAPIPQVIFTLGGGSDREAFTAQFSLDHPNLDIWVSTGINSKAANRIFSTAGIPMSRIHLDDQAVDTVTNFTTMVTRFQHRHIKHVYLLTSDFHMRRAQAIAFLVFGSRGIICTPIEIPSTRQVESSGHVLRDVVRSLFWLATGEPGATAGNRLNCLLESLK